MSAWCNIHKWVVRYCDVAKPDWQELDEYIAIEGIRTETETGNTILHLAATGESSSILKYLCKKDRSVNFLNHKNHKGETALHWASASGDVNFVKILVEAGADPKRCDFSGNNVFHFAAQAGNWKVVKFLLKILPGFINRKNISNESPLSIACVEREYQTIHTLVKHGANTRAVLSNYFTTRNNNDIIKCILDAKK